MSKNNKKGCYETFLNLVKLSNLLFMKEINLQKNYDIFF